MATSCFTRLCAIMLMMAIAMVMTTQALSPCDVHVVGVTAGSTIATALKYTCTAAAVPFFTEKVAITARVTAFDGATVRVGMTSGTDCTTYGSFYSALSCGLSSSGPVQQCNITGYSVFDGQSPYCILILGASGNARVAVDLEYFPASYAAQWHLNNTGQFGGTPGNDVNATGAYRQGAYGAGVVTMVVDSGVQANHVEVVDRFLLSLSYNPETNIRDPTPADKTEDHGTGCAGVVSAAINGYCGQGAAPQGSIAGYRVFGNRWSASLGDWVRGMYYDEMSQDGRRVSISSNSWGPLGCNTAGCFFAPAEPAITKSIQTGADTGRNGKGVIYTFAAGNEGYEGGDANMYSYCKLPEVMCIAGSDFNGRRIYYSNTGANLFVNAPTQGQADPYKGLFPSIITAQLGVSSSNCMGTFGGTSSATPLVAGVVAQILGVRPDLTYRDLQYVVQRTADRNDASSPEWFQNAAGVWFSHHNGFGRINAGKAVSLAKTWSLVPNVTGTSSDFKDVQTTITDNSTFPVTSTIVFSAGSSNLPVQLECVTVYLNIAHSRPHDLRIVLTSPSGTKAILARPQKTYRATSLTNYPFAARVFWGESPVGFWTISITDEIAGVVGKFASWAIEMEGTNTRFSFAPTITIDTEVIHDKIEARIDGAVVDVALTF